MCWSSQLDASSLIKSGPMCFGKVSCTVVHGRRPALHIQNGDKHLTQLP